MSRLEDRLKKLETKLEAEAPPQRERPPQISGGGQTKKTQIDFSKYNQIMPENWAKLSPKDYIRYIKKSDPENPKGGTIRSINVGDENAFVLSSYNRTWNVAFKDIKSVFKLNKESIKEKQVEKKVAQPVAPTSVLDNFREISRETTSAKYDELAAEMINLRREITYMKETLGQLTDWVNKQIEFNNQNKH